MLALRAFLAAALVFCFALRASARSWRFSRLRRSLASGAKGVRTSAEVDFHGDRMEVLKAEVRGDGKRGWWDGELHVCGPVGLSAM